MKTINEYTIYCTEEQTKKALELGAPIGNGHYYDKICIINTIDYATPTTEQMIGWLNDKSLQVTIRFRGCSWYYNIMSNYDVLSIGEDVSSRKEATLAAIDTALEYLVNDYLIK